ncbi:MAG TPA: hypothetical protein VGI87_04105 [Solirubrobacteraceae bacterium]|jgi:hypothetical protein
MVDDPLDAIRRVVIDDRSLRERLLPLRDRDLFTAELVQLARDRGIELTSEQVMEGLLAARRARLERWV